MKRVVLIALTIGLSLNLVACASNSKEIATTQDTVVTDDAPKTTQQVINTSAKQSSQDSNTLIKGGK